MLETTRLIGQLRDLRDALPRDIGDSLDFPRIVVIGDQSVGKSSLIESIVGREFIPRGVGTTTRCPLDLRLCHDETTQDYFAVFPEDGENEEIFFHADVFRNIEAEIIRRTNLIKTEVSADPIKLNIFSSQFADLQFFDLPGFIQVSRDGNHSNMKYSIERMVKKYITNKNTIILAVSNAAVDLQNSKALKVARDADPEGNRIIGVLTNVDKVVGNTERNEKVVKVLKNESIPLRHGYFGVVNRSQEQVDDEVPVKLAAQMFEESVEEFPEYQNLLPRFGVEKLVNFLGESLSGLICEGWPTIREELKTRHSMINNELEMLNGEFLNQNTRSLKMMNVLQQLEREIRISIEGSSTCVNLDNIAIGARLNSHVKEGSIQISENVRRYFDEGEFSQKITNADANCFGARDQAMIPREVLEIAVRLLTKPYIENSHQLTKKVATELLKSCSASAERILQDNKKLLVLVKEIFKETIFELQKETDLILTTLVECHYEFVNLEHPQFRENAQKYLGVQQRFLPVQGWFMNAVNQGDVSPLGESFLTLQESDRKSPSSDSSESSIGRETKTHNASKTKKKFFAKNSNESKFYDTDNDNDTTVQKHDANVVQIIGQDVENEKRNKSGKYEMNIPTTSQGRLNLIKGLVMHYMDIVDEVLVDMIPKVILKCMVYKFRTDMSEGSCILSKIKKEEKESELLAVDVENIKRVESLKIETEKLSRGLNIMDSFQDNLNHK